MKSWEEIGKLEAHLEERKQKSVWEERQETVINILKKMELIKSDGADDEEIQRICGIVDVNSFELRSPGTLDDSPLRGLYLKAALMAHDCRGNTHITVDDDFNLTVYASVSIDKGDAIVFNYSSSMLGTVERRAFLKEGKYFECNCLMCQDPEELGAHLSSVICPRCKKGFLGAEESMNPFVRKRNWICRNCKGAFSGELIRTTLDLAQRRILEVDQSCSKVGLFNWQVFYLLKLNDLAEINSKRP